MKIVSATIAMVLLILQLPAFQTIVCRKSGAAVAQVFNVREDVERFAADTGALPGSDEWPRALLRALPGTQHWSGPYLRSAPNDPWGHPLRYVRSLGLVQDFGVYSVGANSVDELGHGDDISSWSGYDVDIYRPEIRGNRWKLFATLLLMVVAVIGVIVAKRRAMRCPST